MSFIVFSALVAAAAPAGFQPPFAASANGTAIQLGIGHAAPLMKDMNGDGLADLVVGEFDGGKARVYLNSGTAQAPKFTDFTLLRGGGKTAAVSYG